jgi:hypothetical protein
MTVAVPPRAKIHQTIDLLRPEQLAELWEFVELLTAKIDEVPLYHIHEQAVSTGIRDMADQHDHYLYGVDKHDA